MASEPDSKVKSLDGHRLLRGLERLERGVDPLEPTQSAPGLQCAGRLYRAVFEAMDKIGELDVRRTFNRALTDYKEGRRR